MKICFCKNNIHDYYVADPESDMDDVYTIFESYFNNLKNSESSDWILDGTFDEIQEKLEEIMQKYKMDFILNRFLNSNLAKILDE